MQVFTWEHVRVVSCSNQSAYDNCSNPNSTGFCWSNMDLEGLGIIGLWPPDEDSMVGQHYGCWGLSSDNGTDVYSARIVNGWSYVRFSDSGNEVNASVSFNVDPQVFNPDLTVVSIQVPWHIGASGGAIVYNGDIYIQGPAGVPPYE
jgi:hypothetical protein